LLRGRPGEPYNIGTDGPETTMRELALAIAAQARESFSVDVAVRHEPSTEAAYLTDNPQRRGPDIGKARGELGYAPSVGLTDGLRRTLTWYLGHPEGTDQ
jgi:dTDP-glucose 4,6-dehydratase/UDP-glucuronate decarboxylase